MKGFKQQFWWGIGAFVYAFLSDVSQAVTLEDRPLFIGNTADANLMLDLDDSGSMDWEMLFEGVSGGLPNWNTTLNSFVNNDGTMSSTGSSYMYLFPNGTNATVDGGGNLTSWDYEGKKLLGDQSGWYAVPPVRAYGFTRSPDYNKSYYDPAQTYQPWPSYAGFTFSNAPANAAPFDPVPSIGAATLDLTTNLSSSSTDWLFAAFDGMACDDAGILCGTSTIRAFSYYPATYFVRDDTASYNYFPTGISTSNFNTDNSVLFEGEAGLKVSPMVTATGLAGASGNLFVGVLPQPTPSSEDTPGVGTSTYSFSMTGTVEVWIRRWFFGNSNNSLWINFRDHGDAEILTAQEAIGGDDPLTDWITDGGQDWYKWRDGHEDPAAAWVWERLATVNLQGSSHQLTLRHRESFSFVDQILITQIGDTPTDIMTLGLPPATDMGLRSCAPADIDPLHYRQFVAEHAAFTSVTGSVDAIGPDGACLTKVEIKNDGRSFPSGRSYTDEIQNFANWFTYSRRRHLAMRGGIAAALEGLDGVRTGLFWFNDLVTVAMDAFSSSTPAADPGDPPTHEETFMKSLYERVSPFGTPTRQSLDHAGLQYKRTDASAPINAQCQRNFTLVFTDGFANALGSAPSPGNVDGAVGTFTGVDPYKDSFDDTLADVAMKYYTETLRTDAHTPPDPIPDFSDGGFSPVNPACTNASPDPKLDCNTELHMNTYVVGLGAIGDIFGVTHSTVADAYTTTPVWVDPIVESAPVQADDLYHAAVNGRGESFLASSPTELKQALIDAINEISEAIAEGGASSVAFNTSTLSNNSIVLTARFLTTKWSGQLLAFALDGSNGNILGQVWEASNKLDTMAINDRVIMTYQTDSGTPANSTGIPFRWANLGTDHKADLKVATASEPATDALGIKRLNYLRGDRSLENAPTGTSFRSRASRLGDIVHSSPVFVGEPESNWPSELADSNLQTFREFKTANKGRTPVVYAGANDGMLHGFTAEATSAGGREVIAYVPEMVYSIDANDGLHYLTDPSYTHKNYVDGVPTVADVISGGEWKTLLFGNLRGGGKGFFALDVTDPANFAESNANNIVLWEFTDANAGGGDLGFIIEKPIIAPTEDGNWVMIFGNGYSSNNDDSVLFIVEIDGGLDGDWSGSVQKVNVGSTGGLASPAVIDANGDGYADRIYAGDLDGNMWAFSLDSTAWNSWDVAYKQGANEKALFTTQTGQPITTSPIVARNPHGDNNDGVNMLVLFGTGQYLNGGDTDPTLQADQSFYAVWDRGNHSLGSSDLEERTISQAAGLREVSGSKVTWNNKKGWFMNFNIAADEGERVVLAPKVRGNILFFNTLIPSEDQCAGGGSGWQMSLNFDNGFAVDDAEGTADADDKGIFDTNNDGVIDEQDVGKVGKKVVLGLIVGDGILGDHRYVALSTGGLTEDDVEIGEEGNRLGRLGWEEISDN